MRKKRTTLQDQLLEVVLSKYARRAEAVDALCELLNVGKDAIYRRLRGDSLLSPDELKLLALEYEISLDAFVFEERDTVFFRYLPFTKPLNNFSEYLNQIYTDLQKVSTISDAKVYYASAEIPIFYYLLFPDLFAFKLYVWGSTIWDFDYLKNKQFSRDLIPPDIFDLADKTSKLYQNIPSVELWSLNIVDFSLSQIEYHVISGGFKEENFALTLCDQLLELCNHLQEMAAAGSKFKIGMTGEHAKPNTFELYHNEMVYTNNTVMVTSERVNMLYTAFINPNFLTSTDSRVCEFSEDWFNRMIGKSERLSLQSAKTRAWFFKGLRKRVETVRGRIKQHIEE